MTRAARHLRYIGRVVYASSDGTMRVYVEAHTLDLRTGATEQTNEFHLVFHCSECVHALQCALQCTARPPVHTPTLS